MIALLSSSVLVTHVLDVFRGSVLSILQMLSSHKYKHEGNETQNERKKATSTLQSPNVLLSSLDLPPVFHIQSLLLPAKTGCQRTALLL